MVKSALPSTRAKDTVGRNKGPSESANRQVKLPTPLWCWVMIWLLLLRIAWLLHSHKSCLTFFEKPSHKRVNEAMAQFYLSAFYSLNFSICSFWNGSLDVKCKWLRTTWGLFWIGKLLLSLRRGVATLTGQALGIGGGDRDHAAEGQTREVTLAPRTFQDQ